MTTDEKLRITFQSGDSAFVMEDLETGKIEDASFLGEILSGPDGNVTDLQFEEI